MCPFFSVITPTLQRDSLVGTCASLDQQKFTDFEHVIIVDAQEINWELFRSITVYRRKVECCFQHHGDGGNTCRHNAWDQAKGRYLLYLDDDNVMADENALQRIFHALDGAKFPLVAFFPIMRLGQRFFPPDPPRSCHVDTLNLVVRRVLGRWPLTDAYGSDGILVESLVSGYPYRMFPEVEPIGILPKISFGK